MKEKARFLTADEKGFYRHHIIQCEQGGCSPTKYCKLHKLHLNRFVYQRKKFLQTQTETTVENKAFLPATLKPFTIPMQADKRLHTMILRLKNGCGLEMPLDMPLDWVGELLLKAGKLL